ncbi:undecaprenyldiphospho-muramoylpentapeptide beta-N-acetylglucosaminyltransferase [Anoxybacter fermentans]|uniref:UDP-N-acetylglucosamine--N-acetylmuramyl-(pentapeptide) pyrophosphoryl-undecaprenol N-acetylglucosamine transferase n=1 Tax=Anoxybacter fermentans TaxID=1323375 RepID=A0A3S9SXF6_9FIRM|nr:undecaprenyldiphospho-muramoylpentapeptide beta-N-acetylglucosaminyltransferase [Anoxybacter fermentans]AZR73036.1 undecaprenyldiphospho-muramoylpentapeptide beta-N-acetylglucosaminyltransferase [Anoxybacter fermentans]
MRFIITGGGTGGHIYPALSIAEGLKKEFDNPEILYIGTRSGLEKEVVPRAGYPIEFIQASGLSRKISFDNLKTLLRTLYGVGQSIVIIKRFKPDLVIGTGGFVAGPVMLAAILLGKSTLIHEQNAYPGLTNRLISKYVDHIAISFEESKKYFKGKKITHTGNPIRKEILTRTRNEGYKNLQLDRNKKTLLVFGGSGGAKSLNQAMLDFYKFIQKNPDFQLIHVTGKRDYKEHLKEIKERGIELSPRIRIEEYLYQIEDAYAVADLIIGRAGAITLAEITARGIPAILIPFPYATENHQEHNARTLEKKGAARVILDHQLTGDKLAEMVNEIFSTQGLIKRMKEASLKLGRPDAEERIINIIKEILNK